MTSQPLTVSVQAVRDYLVLNSADASSRYTAATIGSNIRAAQSAIEQATNRWFVERDNVTFRATSMGRAVVAVPGFSTLTTVYYQGALQTIGYDVRDSASCWAVPDAQQSGVYTAVQFRAFRAGGFGSGLPGTPYGPWISNPSWFDQAADSPFFPANYGGGYFYGSMPNDTIVVGTGGYAAGTEPDAWLHAVLVLAAFYTVRPASILADSAITPQGGVLTYSQMPAEVRQFVQDWSAGQQAVSVG